MSQPTTARPRRRMPAWLRIAGWVVGLGLMIALAAAGALFFAVQRTARDLPDFEAMKIAPTGTTIRIHSSDGSLLQSLGPAYGEWVPGPRIPATMRNAIIAVEDRRYESHFGVDPKALARVTWLAWKNRGSERRLQGASTITQQAARTVFLSQRYDWRRKAKEMVIAMAMERRLDKDRVLELYLNRVYFGGGAWGIDAASRKFFGHPATTLSTAEAALLAGLVKAPSDYAPSADPDAAYSRMKVVLGVMRETGRATAAQVASAARERPAFAAEAQARGNGARYFTDWIKPQIDAIAGERTGTVDVFTTFDPKLQAIADEAVSEGAPKGAQGALVTLDSDGAVRAMVGGTDYETSSYNRATQAIRQPGSAFKLFVYIAALENGYRPGSAVTDAPITIAGWSPRNSTGAYAGQVSLSSAFAQSLNTVAARLGQVVGVEEVARVARRFGFSTRINIDPAMVLGTSEARVIDMTRAFASIASGGVAVPPYGIERIEAGGKVVYKHESGSQLLVAPQVAKEMTSMMRGAVSAGTAAAADIGRPVAGKTGTTSSGKDGWFLGFSSGLTTGVWIGRDDAKPVPDLQGGRAPARIFAQYMRQAVKGRPVDQVDDVVVSETQADEAASGAGDEQATDTGAAQPRRSTEEAIDAAADEDDGYQYPRPAQRPRPRDQDDAPIRADGRSRAMPIDEYER